MKSEVLKKIAPHTLEKSRIRQLINFDRTDNTAVKVSVVVPVCNVQEYLRECLDSIIGQSLAEIEIICVNDGSTDGSEAILEEYAAKDKRVKVVDKENAGYGQTMNVGMDLASGEYIGIVESDDYVDLHMYEDLYNIAKEQELDFIKANFNRFMRENGETKEFFNRIVAPGCYNRVIKPREERIVFRGVINTWSGIYKKAFLQKFGIRHNETPGASYQDNGFFFQTFMFADRAYFSERAYYMNRRDNPNSSVYSNAKMYCMRDEYRFIQNILDKNPGYSKKLKPYFWLKKFKNYLFTCDRLDNEKLKIFLETFYDEFRQARESGELDVSVFDAEDLEKLFFLLEDKERYYEAILCGPIRISVVIPVYNEEKWIRKCLDSIYSQTLKDIEIICVDDGSTDASLQILSEYSERYKNLEIIRQKNLGAGEARNKGIQAAKGEFIAFMDADDWYPSTTILKNLYIAAKRHNVKVCGGSFSSFIKNKTVTEYSDEFAGYTFTENKLMLFSEYQYDYGYHRFLYDAKMLTGEKIFFPPYRRFQDPPFFNRAMITAQKFYAIKQVVYCYRKDDSKLVWTKEKVLDLLHGIRDNMILARDNNLAKLYFANVNRLNKDFVKVITSFILPEKKDVCLALFEIQALVDEKMISQALGGKVTEYIIKPLYRALFDKPAAASAANSRTVTVINEEKIYDALLELKRDIHAYGDAVAIRMSLSYRIGRVITFIPRKIRDLFRKKRSKR